MSFNDLQEMKITAPSHIIKIIVRSLENSTQIKAFQLLNDIKYKIEGSNRYIEFTHKDGTEFNTVDAFWLGFLSRNYL